jgi:histidinol dehydrogenase
MVADDLGPELLDLVDSAGAVFVGPWSPASLGDYVAGPNHVLPTNRTARFSSALRADDFRRHIHAVTVSTDALQTLGPSVITLARTEGLPAHADSVRRRLDALADPAAALDSANPPDPAAPDPATPGSP